MENLDTDLALAAGGGRRDGQELETPEANSWLPFTGDMHLREAIAAFLAARTGHPMTPSARSSSPAAASRASSTRCSSPSTRATR